MRTRLALAVLLIAALPGLASAAGGPSAEWQTVVEHPLSLLDAPGATPAPAPAPVLGRPLLLHFWASWCAPCRRELPALDARVARWTGEGLQTRVVSVDREADRARRFAAELALGLPLYIDAPDGLAAAMDLPSLPCTFLFDAKGQRVLELHGESDENLRALDAALAVLLKGPAAAESASLGGGQ